MKPSIDTVRELAGKNGALLQRANTTRQALLSAADVECRRLSKLVDGVSHAEVLTDDNKAADYQKWVTQRAGLQRLLADGNP